MIRQSDARVSRDLALADALFLAARLLGPRGFSALASHDARSLRALDAILETADPAVLEDSAVEGGECFHDIKRAAASVRAEAWTAEYARLFEGNTPCPPSEAAFVLRDRGAILGDIAGFYEAFGFRPAKAACHRVDHVTMELEFLALLVVMEVEARRAENAVEAETARVALRHFAVDHFGVWIEGFAANLAELAVLEPYRVLGRILPVLWRRLARRYDVPVEGLPTASAAALDEGTPYQCGLAAGSGIDPPCDAMADPLNVLSAPDESRDSPGKGSWGRTAP